MPTDQSEETVQAPAPKSSKESAPATYTDGQKENNDPYRGHGGEYYIDDKGNRVPVESEK